MNIFKTNLKNIENRLKHNFYWYLALNDFNVFSFNAQSKKGEIIFNRI
jgi:hypothetical protein